MLMTVFGALGVETTFADACDLAAFEAAIRSTKPGAVVIESITNPLLRVCALDKIAAMARSGERAADRRQHFRDAAADAAAGAGREYCDPQRDQISGGARRRARRAGVSDAENFETLNTLLRTLGPNLGPFEAYLTMRGIKTLALRMEKQCANACRLASWLATHPRIERVHFRAIRRIPTPRTSSACSRRIFMARWYVRTEGRRQSRSLRLHGKAQDDRVRHFAGRRAHHDALPGHVLASRISPKHRERSGSATIWSASRPASKRSRTSSRTWTRRCWA